jgi:S1-C subfamily serine protease
MTVTLALLAAPDIARDEVVIKGRSPFSGATVANLSPALADELQIQNAEQGVVVLDVENGSYASNLGFRRGDVVLAVNGRTIDKTGELARVTEQSSRTWRVTIRRGVQQISAVFGG